LIRLWPQRPALLDLHAARLGLDLELAFLPARLLDDAVRLDLLSIGGEMALASFRQSNRHARPTVDDVHGGRALDGTLDCLMHGRALLWRRRREFPVHAAVGAPPPAAATHAAHATAATHAAHASHAAAATAAATHLRATSARKTTALLARRHQEVDCLARIVALVRHQLPSASQARVRLFLGVRRSHDRPRHKGRTQPESHRRPFQPFDSHRSAS